MHIPEGCALHEQSVSIDGNVSPVEDQDSLDVGFPLHDACRNTNIVKETEPHVFVRLGMMARRTHNREAFLDLASCHSQARIDDATARELCTMRSAVVDVKRQALIELL
jgi:hypothetical protein